VEEEQEETLLHATQSKNVDTVKAKGKKESKYMLCTCITIIHTSTNKLVRL